MYLASLAGRERRPTGWGAARTSGAGVPACTPKVDGVGPDRRGTSRPARFAKRRARTCRTRAFGRGAPTRVEVRTLTGQDRARGNGAFFACGPLTRAPGVGNVLA